MGNRPSCSTMMEFIEKKGASLQVQDLDQILREESSFHAFEVNRVKCSSRKTMNHLLTYS